MIKGNNSWSNIHSIYSSKGYELHQFIILVALGTKIIHLTGQQGIFVSLTGSSGKGKTTLLRTIASLFGNPKSNPKHFKILDEISNYSPKVLSDLVYEASSCKSIFSTSNSSVTQKIIQFKPNSDAELHRILEFNFNTNFKEIDKYDFHTASELFDIHIHNNFGHIGALWDRRVSLEEHRLPTFVSSYRQQIINAVPDVKSTDRFWIAALTIAHTVYFLFNDILMFPPDSLDFGVRMFNAHKQHIDQSKLSARQILDLFITKYKNSIAMFNHLGILSKEPTDTIVARFDSRKGVIYIQDSTIRSFLHSRNIEYNDFLQELKQSNSIVFHKSYCITTKTRQSAPPVLTLAIRRKAL